MAKPQQPELHRSGTTPADPASAKSQTSASPPSVGGDFPAPVPEENRPGHHPEHEQDKPTDAFVAKAQERTRRSRAAEAGRRAEAGREQQEQVLARV
ncbi:MAG TPA: hypothetical protein VKI19_01360, partial [Acidimicrobiales bacterium]|nr:hypothetical protein [Acidimicrobiales bacterium]